jgi:hypothetical protein
MEAMTVMVDCRRSYFPEDFNHYNGSDLNLVHVDLVVIVHIFRDDYLQNAVSRHIHCDIP